MSLIIRCLCPQVEQGLKADSRTSNPVPGYYTEFDIRFLDLDVKLNNVQMTLSVSEILHLRAKSQQLDLKHQPLSIN
jgi:hypothetical protein